jgi:ubiquinone biosynthesis protein
MQVEGLGRRLDPEVNIWTLARPLIEAWMRDNRGPEARLRQQLDTLAEVIDGVPRLIRSLEALVGDWSREGIVMHAETLAAQAAKRARHLAILLIPVWLVTASLVAIALALLFGR